MPSSPKHPESHFLPPPPWGLVADDLTGACDAAAPFAERGFAAKVLLGRDAAEIAHGGLTAVSTESRDLEPDAATEKAAAACDWFRQQGVRILFKKIDSVLRGNIMQEVAAVLETGNFQQAVLAPAFPRMGRLVGGGILSVSSQEGFTPIDIRERFSGHGSIRVADAANDAELEAIAERALRSEPPPLLAGSAGLATALATYLAARVAPRGKPLKRPHCDAALYFIGSPHAATAAQLDYLIGQRESAVRDLEGLEMDPAARECKRLIVRVGWEHPAFGQCLPLFDWLEAHARAGIVLSGGDTAAFFCDAAGGRAIELGGEAFAGIPWGVLRGGRAGGHLVVTKSGGFGAEQSLLEVDDFLRNRSQRS